MNRTEFDNTTYARLLGNQYKYLEILPYTGEEVETSEDYFKKAIVLKPHKEKPFCENYILEIREDEVIDMVNGEDTTIFYIQF